jgi:hypothetical protein
MSLSELNPWGFTSIAATIISLGFAYFLWAKAVSTPVTRRFIVLLIIEIVTALTSGSGLYMLFNGNLPRDMSFFLDITHHLGDFLVLVLYPIFVAYALPIKFLKPLTTPAGRYTLYTIGLILCVLFMLIHFSIIETDIQAEQIDMLLYLVLVIMFVAMFAISLVGVKLAKTKLAKERAIAFVCALGFRDLAWATVYLSAITGWAEKAPVLISQLYIGPTLIYIPIMAYGILKLQMLDIEIRLKTTIKNSVLASTFVVLFYVITEGANNLLSDQLGGLIGFAASALLTLFLTPLHRWAERFSSKLVDGDIETTSYPASRSLEIYSAAVEEAMAYGEITKGHISLLDRLKETLQVSQDDATRLELNLNFNRASVPG